MSEFRVPAVDISPYVTDGTRDEKATVAAAIDIACREVGFIQIHGHGIDPAVSSALAEAMDGFFGLSMDDKKSWRRPASENRGYTPPNSESLSLSLGVESASRMNDFFEAYNVGRSVETSPMCPSTMRALRDQHLACGAGFRGEVSAYFVEAQRVAVTMTRIFADALNRPSGFFDALTDHSIDVLRMNNYALPPGTDVTSTAT